MQMEDRDASLIRVEEQLKESAKNQASMMADLKDIFNRLEKESKASMIISGDLKSHIESSKYRCDAILKRLDDGDAQFKDIVKDLTGEKEGRIKFEQNITSSIRTIKWVFGSIATIAAILSSILGILQILGKLQ